MNAYLSRSSKKISQELLCREKCVTYFQSNLYRAVYKLTVHSQHNCDRRVENIFQPVHTFFDTTVHQKPIVAYFFFPPRIQTTSIVFTFIFRVSRTIRCTSTFIADIHLVLACQTKIACFDINKVAQSGDHTDFLFVFVNMISNVILFQELRQKTWWTIHSSISGGQ